MAKRSAGLLLFRRSNGIVEVLLAHPGGPLHARRDVWTVPKGECEPDEDARSTAYREFAEEIGHPPPDGPALDLGEITQKGGKRVVAWAVEGDLDEQTVLSNSFTMIWPPGSGREQQFPEIDRAAWFDVATARTKLLAAQGPLLDRLLEHLDDA